ncbi:MAG TPA: hypothetical protein VKW06_21055 [Candidatus Angelobacter sp.]|nr:hypothetical protein [Candidatus Angelobacter sp.]
MGFPITAITRDHGVSGDYPNRQVAAFFKFSKTLSNVRILRLKLSQIALNCDEHFPPNLFLFRSSDRPIARSPGMYPPPPGFKPFQSIPIHVNPTFHSLTENGETLYSG